MLTPEINSHSITHLERNVVVKLMQQPPDGLPNTASKGAHDLLSGPLALQTIFIFNKPSPQSHIIVQNLQSDFRSKHSLCMLIYFMASPLDFSLVSSESHLIRL